MSLRSLLTSSKCKNIVLKLPKFVKLQSIQIQSCLELQGQSKHQRENQLIHSGVSILVTSLCMEMLSGEVRGSMMQNRLQ